MEPGKRKGATLDALFDALERAMLPDTIACSFYARELAYVGFALEELERKKDRLTVRTTDHVTGQRVEIRPDLSEEAANLIADLRMLASGAYKKFGAPETAEPKGKE